MAERQRGKPFSVGRDPAVVYPRRTMSMEMVMADFDFPPEFRTRQIVTNGTSIHVRSGGAGPAVLLLHGYGETGDMWAPMAADLARDHTVVVPDLRGMGLSSKPAGGFDKKTQAGDVAGVLYELKINRADLLTHDIRNK